MAAIRGHAEVVQTLLNNGANIKDINEVCDHVFSPFKSRLSTFFLLIIMIFYLVFDLLWPVFHFVCFVCQYEETALLLAASIGYVEVVQVLLNNGADVNDCCRVCVCFLPSRNIYSGGEIWCPCCILTLQMTKIIHFNFGLPCLWLSIFCFLLLFFFRRCLRCCVQNGFTALMKAVFNTRVGTIKALLKAGADVNVRNNVCGVIATAFSFLSQPIFVNSFR